ncbi:putative inorganic phosphate cotransporter [Cherax quadricarinatus]|uniref:putative inorganic phosphate cotransporter n=1 Tax=Cherax quadricarinatus TaxID=27406 RepID=UPI00387ECAFA
MTRSPALLDDSVMEGELDWDEVTQGFVLGAFFYGYCVTQIIGGRLSEVYGTRIVFGLSILAGGISAVLTPMAARMNYIILIIIRIIQGLFQGATIPCIFPLMVRWMPLQERSRFIAYVLFCKFNVCIAYPSNINSGEAYTVVNINSGEAYTVVNINSGKAYTVVNINSGEAYTVVNINSGEAYTVVNINSGETYTVVNINSGEAYTVVNINSGEAYTVVNINSGEAYTVVTLILVKPTQ